MFTSTGAVGAVDPVHGASSKNPSHVSRAAWGRSAYCVGLRCNGATTTEMSCFPKACSCLFRQLEFRSGRGRRGSADSCEYTDASDSCSFGTREGRRMCGSTTEPLSSSAFRAYMPALRCLSEQAYPLGSGIVRRSSVMTWECASDSASRGVRSPDSGLSSSFPPENVIMPSTGSQTTANVRAVCGGTTWDQRRVDVSMLLERAVGVATSQAVSARAASEVALDKTHLGGTGASGTASLWRRRTVRRCMPAYEKAKEGAPSRHPTQSGSYDGTTGGESASPVERARVLIILPYSAPRTLYQWYQAQNLGRARL